MSLDLGRDSESRSEVWGVPESLGKDSPGELCGEVSVRVSPGEGKDILRLRAERNREKSILEV